MKWLENNPLGLALSAILGVLLLSSMFITWEWSLPVRANNDAGASPRAAGAELNSAQSGLGPISDYQLVNDRPVFNESRRPAAVAETDDSSDEVAEVSVAGAPDVKLTGIVITPEQKLVMLTPNKDGKAVIAYEGMNLEGDYVGWAVNDVQERQVTLKSLDGSELSLELQVNDQMIKEPPKPVPAPTQQADDQPGGDQADGDQAPLSRAEEIRRRIEERREQLKQEAEASDDASDDASAEKKNRYQEAIRAMLMKRASEKKDDADGSQN